MKLEILISQIEKEANASLKDIVNTGIIYKDKFNLYKVNNDFLTNKRKLIKIFKDLKYRNFSYIPF